MPERDESNHLILFAHVLAKFQFIEEGIRIYVRTVYARRAQIPSATCLGENVAWEQSTRS